MHGFKIANGALGQRIREQRNLVEQIEARLAQLPAKVPISSIAGGSQPKKTHEETRRLMHVFRMAAHRAESGLRELFRPVYPRWRHESLANWYAPSSDPSGESRSRQRVSSESPKLREQASPHRTRVLEHLCSELNTLDAKFPGSDLVLRFSVRGAETVAGSEGG